jgi:hypothetical protein
MRGRLAAVVIVVLAAGCGSHHGAPNVKGKPLPTALAQLRAHGWLVAVPSFPPVDGGLKEYRVVAERTTGRRTVTLKVAQAPVQHVTLTLVGTNPPPVPRVVGQTYRNARRSGLQNAVFLRVVDVKPLRPALSADGIDAFVVVSQRSLDAHTIAVRLGERPCWKTVINDWYVDTQIDGIYARRGYREALDALPDDGPRSEVERALRSRLR